MPKAKKTKKEEIVIGSDPLPASQANVEHPDAIFDMAGELVVDVFEDDEKNFVVVAAIAGVQIKDLDISLDNNMMVIKGNRQNPYEVSEKTYFYQECYFGPFARKIVLPENIHTDKASAEMDKGMLTIKIPRKEEKDIKTV